MEFELDDYITSLEDFQCFTGLTSLWVEAHKINDISALRDMPQLETLWLIIDTEIEDLSPVGEVRSLVSITMWGQEYPRIADLSFLMGLKRLEKIMLLLPSVDDINILAELPRLKEVGLWVKEGYDDSNIDYTKWDSANINSIDKINPKEPLTDGEEETSQEPETAYELVLKELRQEKISNSSLVKQNGYYIISSLDDLVYMQKAVNQQITYKDGTEAQTGKYKLTTDLDFSTYSENWVPIGSGEFLGRGNWVTFSGEFDGGNHAISNFSIKEVEGRYFTGLFGYINKGELENIRLIDCDVEGYGTWTGGLAGGIWNTWGEDFSTIFNCHVSGKVRGEDTVGGVAYNSILIENSSFVGTIEGRNPAASIGGIAFNAHRIYSCYADTTVTAAGSAGGIAVESNYIENCYTAGTINCEEGRVAGIVVESSTIAACYTTAELSGQEVAGITLDNRELFNQLDGDVAAILRGTVVASKSITSIGGRSSSAITAPLGLNQQRNNNWAVETLETNFKDTDATTRIAPETLLKSSTWKRILSESSIGAKNSWTIVSGEYPRLKWQTTSQSF